MAWPKGRPRPPNAGRRKGTPDKNSIPFDSHGKPLVVSTIARALVSSPEYLLTVQARLLSGTLAPALEAMLWYYAYMKPREQLALTGEDGGPLQIVIQRRILVAEDDAPVLEIETSHLLSEGRGENGRDM